MKDMLMRLRKVFSDSKESQTAIAKKTNVTSAYIWKILNNDSVRPRDLFIDSVCREFNVNENWLRNGIGDMYIKISRDEQIAGFVGSVLATEEETFKKRFIQMLSQLDEDDWESLEKMVLLMSKKPEKD